MLLVFGAAAVVGGVAWDRGSADILVVGARLGDSWS
jgi:hypothetical protein